MKISHYSATHIGLVRTQNQDSFLADGENQLFVVADGMGGHKGGEVASGMTVDILSKSLVGKKNIENSKDMFDELRNVISIVNKDIYQKGQSNKDLNGMGTTLCLFFIADNGIAYIANIGDSRLYMHKDNEIWLLTEDHNFRTERKKHNFLMETNLDLNFDDNILTRSLGFSPEVEPDFLQKPLEKGERYLLCSDGLSGFVKDKEIADILGNMDLKDVPKTCIQKALSRGGEDNVSIIVVEIQ